MPRAQVYDYLSADALAMFSLLLTVARVSGLARPRQWLPLGACGAAALLYHAHYMLTVLFDYGLNVALCVAGGAVQTLLWAGWALGGRHPRRAQLLMFLVRILVPCLLGDT